MKINLLRNTETLSYAVSELKKYILKMNGECDADITIAHLSDLSLSEEGVDDAMIDDVIDIKIEKMKGYIAGSNDRSVLMGVYTFLKSAGCMWVRPGKGGEYIPECDISSHSLTYRKKADYSFRGECIEGAVSYEHLRDTVEWLPKVNMNFFMIEQVVPYNYMGTWYRHSDNPLYEDENVSYEDVKGYVKLLEADIKRCGLQLHSLGHGYFFAPYGIEYKQRGASYEISDECRAAIAKTSFTNGKREFWGYAKSPNLTQLCFSNEKARRDHVLWLVNYIKEKPYIDFLHVWLGDGANNQCECEDCAKHIVSDWYVMMLNELDAEFTKEGIDTKIVFIMYNDTMWAPIEEKLNNKNRFMATVTIQARDHSKVFSPERYKGELEPYKLNQISYLNGMNRVLSFIDSWKPAFDGRKFIFEYRMYRDHYIDPGYMNVSEIMHKDCIALSSLGLDGILSDKTQRSYFPTGLPMSVMGENLFDKCLDYPSFVERFFEKSYGKDYKLAKEYLEKITEYFDPDSSRIVTDITEEDTGAGVSGTKGGIRGKTEIIPRIEKIAPLADSFAEIVKRNMESENPCHRESWKILMYHCEYVKHLSYIYISVARLEMKKAREQLAKMLEYLCLAEREIHPQFDLHLFKAKMDNMVKD